MSFFAYRIQGTGHYKLLSPIDLARPIAIHVRERTGSLPSEQEGAGWHIAEAQLLDRLDHRPPKEHALLMGLKPHAKNFVEMYRLTDLWGFSYRDWTPILLGLRQLTDENRWTPNPAVFSKAFKVTRQVTEPTYHFHYLNGGLGKETWSWGSPAKGLSLPAAALEFFCRSIKGEGQAVPSETVAISASGLLDELVQSL